MSRRDLVGGVGKPTLALMEAVGRGDAAGTRAALVAGADVDHRDGLGWTAAMRAAAAGMGPCLDLLIQAGARLDLRTPQGDSAEDLASREGRADCSEMLRAARAEAGVSGAEPSPRPLPMPMADFMEAVLGRLDAMASEIERIKKRLDDGGKG